MSNHEAKEEASQKKMKRGRPKRVPSAQTTLDKKVEKSAKKAEEPKRIIKPENYFFLCDGRAIKDLAELAEFLETMNDGVFSYHANDVKNDFSSWIKDIFENKELADEIYMVRDPKQIKIIILKNLTRKENG